MLRRPHSFGAFLFLFHCHVCSIGLWLKLCFCIVSEDHQKYFGGGKTVPKTINKVIGKMPPVTMMGGMGGLTGLSSQPNSFTGVRYGSLSSQENSKQNRGTKYLKQPHYYLLPSVYLSAFDKGKKVVLRTSTFIFLLH